LYFEDASAHIFVLPGVPFEMKDIFTREVLPILKSFTGSGKLIHQNMVVSGIGESFLSDLIQPWEQNLPEDVSLAYLPSPGLIRLRLSAFTKSEKAGRGKLQLLFDALRPLIKDYFVSDRDEKLSETLLRELLEARKTISTAESCTGGYIAHQLTSVPGSSGAFLGSVIAYSNDVKTNMLRVNEDTLSKFGAVSAETVKEMAENARSLLKTDFSIAVSGIAGPDGGTDEKPVGLVYIAVASAKETTVEEFHFGGFRETNIARSGVAAMNMCIKALRKERK
jgi:nicotinamide-nucleotide amidase